MITHSRTSKTVILSLGVLLLILVGLSVFIGRYPQPGIMNPNLLKTDTLAYRLVTNLRLPRIFTAVLLGMALSAAGSVLQVIFANPLVEPGFLGVSQGAAFGAAFSIIYISPALWSVQLAAFICAFLGMGFSYFVARRVRFGGWVLRLIMAGIAISALFSSGVGILKLVADPLSQLPDITFWMLGGLWSITWQKLFSILPTVGLGLMLLMLMRWRLNLLSLNDQSSFSLGLFPARERLLILVAAVMVTAAVISVAGIVGWIGLIMPQIARRLFGADSRYALPGATLLGGIFALVCDDLARTLFPGELPLGILTSLIGAIVFLILLARGQQGAKV
ncbi:MAG TPA: iron ABC transporter permease [Anaerolineaceae bacterium]|nr:iron ABC transporter permease [Anaerolineaceae bacterium]